MASRNSLSASFKLVHDMLLAMENLSVLHVGGSCLLVSDIFISAVQRSMLKCGTREVFYWMLLQLLQLWTQTGKHKTSMLQTDTQLMSWCLCRLSQRGTHGEHLQDALSICRTQRRAGWCLPSSACRQTSCPTCPSPRRSAGNALHLLSLVKARLPLQVGLVQP